MINSTIKGAIIDLDGTILDSAAVWDNLPVMFLSQCGISVGKDEGPGLADLLTGMSLREAVNALSVKFALDLPIEVMMDKCTAIITSAYRDSLCLMPGARSALEGLSSLGVKMCVATASNYNLTKIALERCAVSSYFKFIITEEEVSKSKRYPDIYFIAAKRLGLSVKECIVFEDAPHAIDTARNAGFPVLTSLLEYSNEYFSSKDRKGDYK